VDIFGADQGHTHVVRMSLGLRRKQSSMCCRDDSSMATENGKRKSGKFHNKRLTVLAGCQWQLWLSKDRYS